MSVPMQMAWHLAILITIDTFAEGREEEGHRIRF